MKREAQQNSAPKLLSMKRECSINIALAHKEYAEDEEITLKEYTEMFAQFGLRYFVADALEFNRTFDSHLELATESIKFLKVRFAKSFVKEFISTDILGKAILKNVYNLGLIDENSVRLFHS